MTFNNIRLVFACLTIRLPVVDGSFCTGLTTAHPQHVSEAASTCVLTLVT